MFFGVTLAIYLPVFVVFQIAITIILVLSIIKFAKFYKNAQVYSQPAVCFKTLDIERTIDYTERVQIVV